MGLSSPAQPAPGVHQGQRAVWLPRLARVARRHRILARQSWLPAPRVAPTRRVAAEASEDGVWPATPRAQPWRRQPDGGVTAELAPAVRPVRAPCPAHRQQRLAGPAPELPPELPPRARQIARPSRSMLPGEIESVAARRHR